MIGGGLVVVDIGGWVGGWVVSNLSNSNPFSEVVKASTTMDVYMSKRAEFLRKNGQSERASKKLNRANQSERASKKTINVFLNERASKKTINVILNERASKSLNSKNFISSTKGVFMSERAKFLRKK